MLNLCENDKQLLTICHQNCGIKIIVLKRTVLVKNFLNLLAFHGY